MTIWVKLENVAKGPEFWHVGFVSSEKHCSECFFFSRWVALSFRELAYAKTLAFPSHVLRGLFVEQETGRLFIVLVS